MSPVLLASPARRANEGFPPPGNWRSPNGDSRGRTHARIPEERWRSLCGGDTRKRKAQALSARSVWATPEGLSVNSSAIAFTDRRRASRTVR
ncbi:hypothetical protein [Scytonema sp. PCC 10023]|uniref:hypothetical protein n=1 Tax=Scytonema sp. PCC 10023 TaxID=1680591 RepID=UPI0039C67238